MATDWDSVSAIYGILQLRVFLHGTERCSTHRDRYEPLDSLALLALHDPHGAYPGRRIAT